MDWYSLEDEGGEKEKGMEDAAYVLDGTEGGTEVGKTGEEYKATDDEGVDEGDIEERMKDDAAALLLGGLRGVDVANAPSMNS